MQVPKGKKIDIGFRVGKLTVRERTRERKNGYMVWRCACDCGGEILLDTRCLQRGTVTDCGCDSKVRPGQRDLTGERFGRLVCLEPTRDRDANGRVIWKCRCDCGNLCTTSSKQLMDGQKQSCGCMRRKDMKDYTGERFGALTVTGYAGKSGRKEQWRCKCDCGNETVVAQANLRSGHTRSCGCLQRETYRENLKLVEGTSVVMIEHRMKTPIKSNTSGANGVYYNRNNQMWSAQITFKGRTYFLGNFREFRDAVQARKRGEEMYDHFLEWYYSRNLERAPL